MKLIDKNKEVDLEKEIEAWEDSFKHCPASMKYKETAKHFFELGMQTSNQLTWKDIQQIILIAVKLKTDVHFEAVRLRTDLLLNNKKMTEEMFYTEVLKRFKENMRKQ